MLRVYAYMKKKEDEKHWERAFGYFPISSISNEVVYFLGDKIKQGMENYHHLEFKDLENLHSNQKDDFEFYLTLDPAFGLCYFVMWNMALKEPGGKFRLLCKIENEEI